MEYIIKAFKACDIFGQQIALNFRKRTLHQTVMGGLLSILTISVFVVFFQKEAFSLINKNKVTLSMFNEIQQDPPLQQIQTNELMFAFKINGQEMINRRFFDVQLIQVNRSKNGTKITKQESEMQYEKCTLEHFKKIQGLSFAEDYEFYHLDEYYCPNLNSTFQLQGVYQSDVFSYIKLQVKKCSKDCYNESELDEYLNHHKYFTFDLLVSNLQIDPENKIPYQGYLIDQIYFDFLPNTTYLYSADVFLDIQNFSEDDSILPTLTPLQYQQFYMINDIKEKTFIIKNNQDEMCQMYFRLSQKMTSFNKSYTKLDEFLAYVGGFLKTVILVIGLFASFYNKYDLCVQLANKLYIFDYYEENKSEDKISYEQLSSMIQQRVKKVQSKFSINARKILNITKLNKLKLFGGQSQPQQQLNAIQEQQIQINTQQLNNSQDNIPLEKQTSDDEQKIYQFHTSFQKKKLIKNSTDSNLNQRKFNFSLPNEPNKSNLVKQRTQRKSSGTKRFQISNQEIFKNRQSFLRSTFQQIIECKFEVRMKLQYVISRLFCRKLFYKGNKQIQMVDKAVRLIKRDLDIETILDRLQEIEKFKKLLLTQDELNLFEYTLKPVIKWNDFSQEQTKKLKKMKTALNQKQTFKSVEQYFKLYKAYMKVAHSEGKEKENLDVQKKKELLIQLLGMQLVDIFEAAQLIPEEQVKQLDNVFDTFNNEEIKNKSNG